MSGLDGPAGVGRDGDTDAVGALGRVDGRFADLRANDGRRRRALVGAVLAGLALGWVHWTGLVVGGALVGLTRTTLRRAIVAAVAFGALSVAITVVTTPTMGPGDFVGHARIALVTVAVGIVLPAWGALARAAL